MPLPERIINAPLLTEKGFYAKETGGRPRRTSMRSRSNPSFCSKWCAMPKDRNQARGGEAWNVNGHQGAHGDRAGQAAAGRPPHRPALQLETRSVTLAAGQKISRESFLNEESLHGSCTINPTTPGVRGQNGARFFRAHRGNQLLKALTQANAFDRWPQPFRSRDLALPGRRPQASFTGH